MDKITTHIRTVTSKGQVTIPVQVRRLLGVRPQDKVVFYVSNGKVELQPVPMTLEETFCAVPPLKQPLSSDEIREIVDEERAERWRESERRAQGRRSSRKSGGK